MSDENTRNTAGTAPVMQRLNLGLLHPSPTNPRRHFDQAGIEELAASIEEHGVKMPLLLRPSRQEPGRFEIVAGERRYRGSIWLQQSLAERIAAGEGEEAARLSAIFELRTEVPCIVEDLDDATVLELQLLENLQRRDLTALEEARGYQQLIDLQAKAYTPALIAKKIGKHINTVLYKLKMLQAPRCLQEALEKGTVGERHLVMVAGIPGSKAREECAKKVLVGGWGEGAMSVREVGDLISAHYRKSLKKAPWSLDDADLVKDAGPCTMCPHFARKAAEQDADLAAELGNERGQTDPLTCLNPSCFASKQDAEWKRRQALAKEGQMTVLKPKETEKYVSEFGSLRWDAKVVRLDEKPGYDFIGHHNSDKMPTWSELLEGQLEPGKIMVANTKHGGIVELVSIADAVSAAKKHPKHGKIFEKVKDSGKRELTAAEKKRKDAEAFENKVAAKAKNCLLQHLYDEAMSKGMGVEASMAVLDSVLHEAGMDGNKQICSWLKIEPKAPKKGDALNQTHYRTAILDRLREFGAGKPEIDAMIMIGAVAKWVRSYGFEISSLQPLQKHFGFDKKTITALATAEVKAEIAEKDAKKKSKTVSKSSKPEADHGNQAAQEELGRQTILKDGDKHRKNAPSRSRGAPIEASKDPKVRSVDEYCCDACGCSVFVDFGLGEKAARLGLGQMKCVGCGGEWPSLAVHHRDNKSGFSDLSVEDQALAIMKGELTYVDILGPTPKRKAPERAAYDKNRIALHRAVTAEKKRALKRARKAA